MARTLKFAALAAALMLSASVVGASAFTSAEITRSTSVTVADDDAAAAEITFADGGLGVATFDGQTGKMALEFDDLNRGSSSFTFGSQTSVQNSNTAAFTFTPGQSGDGSYTVDVTSSNDLISGVSMYTSDGSLVESDTTSVAGGETVYVVLTVDLASGDTASGGNVVVTANKV
ncbi:hypothetical protein [Halomarina oriensis]|uniref:DUF1102 domain-containing protein n=1 Tax=Halomarina oriensis TaxID=671145 RepID=A0A6B0GE03_9EURY|nr:hypothetical protein [Halomarina oriensis]MWG33166.1 hypothetical protein [Halomarina oriensis]